MALIFCDGFDHYATDDITKKWTNVTNNCAIDNSFKRTGTGSLYVKSSSSSTNTNEMFVLHKAFENNYKTLVVGFSLMMTVMEPGYYFSINFYDTSIRHVSVRLTSDFVLVVYMGSTVIGTSPVFCSLGEMHYMEIKVIVDDVSGSVTIKKNESLFYELNGIDTRNGGNASCNTVALGVRNVYSYVRLAVYIDDLYIDDADFLGDIKVETLYPSGAGANTQWTPLSGENYENVCETPQDGDTSYVATDVVDGIDTYAFEDLEVSSGTVFGVQVNLMAKKDDAGYRSIAPVVRSASTDIIGDTKSINDNYMDYIQMYLVNPEDSQAWEIEDINGAEFGIKCIE